METTNKKQGRPFIDPKQRKKPITIYLEQSIIDNYGRKNLIKVINNCLDAYITIK